MSVGEIAYLIFCVTVCIIITILMIIAIRRAVKDQREADILNEYTEKLNANTLQVMNASNDVLEATSLAMDKKGTWEEVDQAIEKLHEIQAQKPKRPEGL